jgi:hypothetical protein
MCKKLIERIQVLIFFLLAGKKTEFIVWKFLFRRDNQELPPWMTGGKAIAKERGL